MNELIEAAKAVIEMWDNSPPVEWCQRRAALRAAVERAEKQEAKPWTRPIPSDFKEWWETYALIKYGMGPAYHAWSAGQQAERERIKDIIYDYRDVFSEGGLCLIVEKIDDVP